MYLPSLVGLVGRAGSGKDRFYYSVLAQYNYVRIAFGDPVKVLSVIHLLKSYPGILEKEEQLLRVFPSLYLELFSNQKTSLSRTLQQYIGTDLARSFDENYWIKIAEELIKEKLEKGIRVTVTDVRFLNEAESIKKLGGVLVKIVGKGSYDFDDLEAKHQSESELEKIVCDYTESEFVSLIKEQRIYTPEAEK
ncbi:dNMP kinase [Thermus phage YS40_Isch]|nr:dNMP kinase [Thermus phage YS40_Isch]